MEIESADFVALARETVVDRDRSSRVVVGDESVSGIDDRCSSHASREDPAGGTGKNGSCQTHDEGMLVAKIIAVTDERVS